MAKNIKGMRSGKLVALDPTSQRGKYGAVIWLCQCDCGNLCLIPSNAITSKKTISCGCAAYNFPAKAHRIKGAVTFNRKILRVSEQRKDDCVILIICKDDPRWIYPANERFSNYKDLLKENGYECVVGTYDTSVSARDMRRDYIETLKPLILKKKVDLEKGLEALDLANLMNR